MFVLDRTGILESSVNSLLAALLYQSSIEGLWNRAFGGKPTLRNVKTETHAIFHSTSKIYQRIPQHKILSKYDNTIKNLSEFKMVKMFLRYLGITKKNKYLRMSFKEHKIDYCAACSVHLFLSFQAIKFLEELCGILF